MVNTLRLRTVDPLTDTDDIKTAGEMLKNGKIVVIPTETVYGLAADAFNGDAVRRVFEAKGRPADNPLIVHISRYEDIYSLCREVPPAAQILSQAFWPGPFTMIMKKRDSVPMITSGGLDTVAVRMPGSPSARAIIDASCPLAAPSANISGFPSPTCFEHALDDMDGRADAVCDGGECSVGVESTVLTLATPVPTLLRPGGITVEQIESVLGMKINVSDAVLKPLAKGQTAASPGMKYKHYSPKADITIVRGDSDKFRAFIEALPTGDSSAVLCFEEEEQQFCGRTVVTMGRESDPLSQTHALFTSLRRLDELGAKSVYSREPPQSGIGLAVKNRLYRAAGFKFTE